MALTQAELEAYRNLSPAEQRAEYARRVALAQKTADSATARATYISEQIATERAGAVKSTPNVVNNTANTLAETTGNPPVTSDAGTVGDTGFYQAATGTNNVPAQSDDGLMAGVGTTIEGVVNGFGETIADTYNSVTDTVGGLFGSDEDDTIADDGFGTIANPDGVDDDDTDLENETPGGTDGTTDIALAKRSAEFKAQEAKEKQTAAEKADWRVKLQLADKADYLYKATDPGILAPLKQSKGLIFPYTPDMTVQYNASYESYDLTHSNYRGYFYQGSSVKEITVTAVFTAQDVYEANYLLASMHFLRSCTKMFYGQDDNRGFPPPVLFLSGYGEYQYVKQPCLLSFMSYNFPNDVDYIAAGVPDQVDPTKEFTYGLPDRSGYKDWSGAISTQVGRLTGANLPKGADPSNKTKQQQLNSNTGDITGLTEIYNGKTYVPTKVSINFQLLPLQTRKQVSKDFSLKDYASGELIKQGFW